MIPFLSVVLAAGCALPSLGPTPGTPTAGTAETGSTSTGHTATVDTGWALDSTCTDPVDLPIEVLVDRTLLPDDMDGPFPPDNCIHLLGDVAETEAELVAMIDAFSGDGWPGGIDWSSEHALMVTMLDCNQMPTYAFTRLRRCSDGRVAIDAERPGIASDHPSKLYWVLAVPADGYAGSISRVRVCNGEACAEYLDGVLVE